MPPGIEDLFGEQLDASIYRPAPQIVPTGGAAPDLPASRIPQNQLASSLNFVVRDGVVTRRGGDSTLVGSVSNPQSAAQAIFEWVPYDNSPRIILATPTRFYQLDTGAGDDWEDRTTTARTGAYTDAIFFSSMRTSTSGIRVISVNGVDPPSWWTGASASAFVVLSTAVIGSCATVWRSHFLQGDTEDTADGAVPTRIRWSALGDPTVWSGTASAGSLDLLDKNATRVMTFHSLRGYLAAYKEEGVHALIYKGSPFYFTQTTVNGYVTLVSPRSVVPIDNGNWHFIVTKEGTILWDGQTIRAVGRNRVDRTIFADINWAQRNLIHTAWWPDTQEVFLCYPSGSSTVVDSVWIYNFLYDSWWETDFNYSALAGIFNLYNPPRLFGSRAGATNVVRVFFGSTDAPSSGTILASLQTGLQDYGDVDHKGLYKMALVGGPGTGTQATVSITKAGVENPLSTLSFASSQSLTITGGSDLPKIDFRLTNRWIAYRLTHSGAGEALQLDRLIPYLHTRTGVRKNRP